MDAAGPLRTTGMLVSPQASRADRAPRTRAKNWAACGRSQPVHVHRLRTFVPGLLKKLLQLWAGVWIGDDLFPALVAFLSQQEPREVRHLHPLGLGQLL